MSCTLPRGTLEIVILANHDRGQAEVIEDTFKLHHLTMHIKLNQLRQQERETLKCLTK